MAWVIQMTEKGYTSQAQSQPNQDQKRSIRVSWIKSCSPSEGRRAWQHVWACTSGADETAIRKTYEDEVKKVEIAARDTYNKDDNYNSVPRNSDEFVRIMVDQGCSVLLVALGSLGSSEKLGHVWNKKQIKSWVVDLFSIRNQVPLVVLEKLMKQSFFDDVVKSGKWKRPDDLPRMVLYNHLVEPFLDSSSSQPNMWKRLLRVISSRGLSPQEPPPTLLHALWLLLTGPDSGGSGDGGDSDVEEDDVALCTVRSATELHKEKIIFRNKGMGTRGIKFEKNMLGSHLFLPTICIQRDIDKLFEHLIDYEEEIHLSPNRREVSSYLKLMSELVRTPEDVKTLARQGIINAPPDQEDKLPDMLQNLPLREAGNDRILEDVRLKIRNHVKPSKWERVRDLILIGLVITAITGILSLLQTFYTVLAYYKN